jgi:asparagine synthase (glutamine-hydrolysing)
MCGIVGGLGEPNEAALDAIAHRGPDGRATIASGPFWLGSVRLAILDPTPRSDQPFRRGDLLLVYNGELWNHAELRAELERQGELFHTSGDTEVFAAAIKFWGIDALPRMQGMFAAAWTRDGSDILHLVRDRHGEVPLHASVGAGRFAFASELKAFRAMGLHPGSYTWVEPGEIWTVMPQGYARARWYDVPPTGAAGASSPPEARARVRRAVEKGSLERTVADVPVCTLLSGGIDSAVVAAHAVAMFPRLVAYTAVMNPRSPDLRAAREVAEHLGLELVEVQVPAPTADDLASVVRAIEMPHKAQVEIGWACMQLAERMASDGFKVTFSGEGSDELWASYGFAYHGIKQHGWDAYRRRLFREQHRKNFARCNKVFMARGVECRLPFLGTEIVELALRLPQELVQDGRARPKAVLQDSHRDLLPARIVTRTKLAFQDGLGLKPACAAAVADPQRFYAGVYLAEDFG